MGNKERETGTSALFIHVFLGDVQESTPPPPAQARASSLAHSCSAFVSGICPATFFLVCVWVVGGGDSHPAPTVVHNLYCTSQSSGELGPGPHPRTTESEPLRAWAVVFFFFNENPRLRRIVR